MKNIQKFENFFTSTKDSKKEEVDSEYETYYSSDDNDNNDDENSEIVDSDLDSQNESKKNWIKDAIKKPGSLRKSLKKKKDEKISTTEINDEIKKLRKKDKDKSKPGIQGLSKKDLTKFRKLTLAKTLKGLKEHQETQNYMFFANLQNMLRYIDAINELSEIEVDKILSEHDWASDHISVACENLEHVHNFLVNSQNCMISGAKPTQHEEEKVMNFNNFKK